MPKLRLFFDRLLFFRAAVTLLGVPFAITHVAASPVPTARHAGIAASLRKACGLVLVNVRVEHNKVVNVIYVGCDHTSTKAPDPIRTPKLSVLGRE